jgi:serine/threonine-protein kinase
MALANGTILEKRYRVDNMLARGGMGAIYQCFDTNLNIPIAVKENFFSGAQSVKQFQQEARILARLHHPNLPRVIDHFEHDGSHYLVMDYIAGQDLWNMVQQRGAPLEEKQALDYIMQVCDAVIYLHRQKPPIIHRDIKPQNVKITPNGRAFLVDFGIAKIAEQGEHTSTGAQGVTPGFSPPEQYSGEGTSPASDVFSLGATLYAILTGKKPPNSVSLLVDPTKFKPPSAYNAKLSPQLSRAIMHAMQPEIARRPQSVAAWKQELEVILTTFTTIVTGKDNDATAVKLLPQTLWLIGAAGHTFQVGRGSHTMGRGSDCDIYIPDSRASRHHATIMYDGKMCQIRDLNSANGTFVNNQPVTARGYTLKLGDSIQIGDAVFRLSAVNEQPHLSPAPVPYVDTIAGTEFMRDAPDPDLTSRPPSSPGSRPMPLPDSGPTAGRPKSHPWLWVTMGLVILLLLGVIAWAAFTLQNQAAISRQPVDPPTPPVTPTPTITLTPTRSSAEATLMALAATATAQIMAGATPNIDTAATIAAAVAATDQARIPTATVASQSVDTLPTLTPTDTPPPTATATPTLTATPPPLPTSTFTPVPIITVTLVPITPVIVRPSPVIVAPIGVFQDFESESSWRRGDEPNGDFSRSNARVNSGQFAGRLDYRFLTPGNDYVVFLQSHALAGEPTAISAWVYGDGSGHFLNVWIKDSAGEVWQMSFGQITHTGGQLITAPLNAAARWPSGHVSGPDNGLIDYPISFQGLVLDDGADTFIGEGSIFIDDLTSQEASATVASTPSLSPSPVVRVTPVTRSQFRLTVAGQHKYEPWGAPRGDDICAAYRDGKFNDKVVMKGFNIELALTNNSNSRVPDDWAPTFTTAKGRSVQVCFYGYPGSGPPPGATSLMTFFTIVSPDDFVRLIQLDVLNETLQLCLDEGGAETRCF